MPVMICVRCKGQVRDSFHKEPIGLKKNKTHDAKAMSKKFEKEFGVKIDFSWPTKWCDCNEQKD